MHYSDGTPAKHGDLVIKKESHANSFEVVGVVVQIVPGGDTCNAQIVPLAIRQKDSGAAWTPVASSNIWSVTLKDCTKLG